jgi:hypothetical protein
LKLLPFEEEGKGKKRARDDDEEEDRPNKRSGLATSSTSLVDDTFFD